MGRYAMGKRLRGTIKTTTLLLAYHFRVLKGEVELASGNGTSVPTFSYSNAKEYSANYLASLGADMAAISKEINTKVQGTIVFPFITCLYSITEED